MSYYHRLLSFYVLSFWKNELFGAFLRTYFWKSFLKKAGPDLGPFPSGKAATWDWAAIECRDWSLLNRTISVWLLVWRFCSGRDFFRDPPNLEAASDLRLRLLLELDAVV